MVVINWLLRGNEEIANCSLYLNLAPIISDKLLRLKVESIKGILDWKCVGIVV